MTGFVVIVEFRLKAGARPDFRRLIDANASASVAREPGCRRFDVVEPKDAADRVLLYEILRRRDRVRRALPVGALRAFQQRQRAAGAREVRHAL